MSFSLPSYSRILVLISHSQDFLNGVCTNIIHVHQGQLKYYGVSIYISYNYMPANGGNYPRFMDHRSLKARHGWKHAAKPSKQRQQKGDLNAACDRQQVRADPLLFMKRPATLKCPDIALLVHRTTTLRDYPNHCMPFTHWCLHVFGHNGRENMKITDHRSLADSLARKIIRPFLVFYL